MLFIGFSLLRAGCSVLCSRFPHYAKPLPGLTAWQGRLFSSAAPQSTACLSMARLRSPMAAACFICFKACGSMASLVFTTGVGPAVRASQLPASPHWLHSQDGSLKLHIARKPLHYITLFAVNLRRWLKAVLLPPHAGTNPAHRPRGLPPRHPGCSFLQKDKTH